MEHDGYIAIRMMIISICTRRATLFAGLLVCFISLVAFTVDINSLSEQLLDSKLRGTFLSNIDTALDCSKSHACSIMDSINPDLLVVSVCTGNTTQRYGGLTTSSLNLMAHSHHFKTVVLRETPASPRHARWSKVEIAERLINSIPASQAEIIMVLDCDAMFATLDINPRERVASLLEGKTFLAANHQHEHNAECARADDKFVIDQLIAYDQNVSAIQNCVPNSGSWAVRNNAKGAELIHEWLKSYDLGDKEKGQFWMRKETNLFLFDQGGFIKHIWKRYYKEIQLVSGFEFNRRVNFISRKIANSSSNNPLFKESFIVHGVGHGDKFKFLVPYYKDLVLQSTGDLR
ncbi:hypothetical protein SARC_04405 [Sphaeroforma arctica JP610]|uniref:Nucleotide-diphospho-sugar transferase domain-containing protein n=1 Tax=Sphaeroforma arctica JP610 TaxID=667725 RepID=A0A0L0G515_9EUKA|nr:hypothetical protein SARC_04405 [Sphaeroforma arctica JP610]KNC83353.1 hypothetical protein SARC_04405 [Sphaeroforma arctica JP610]|eukprot:XP_014157255.1 hypothetical protein SARC_04405 [Sphaeroforma arctica JP610]